MNVEPAVSFGAAKPVGAEELKEENFQNSNKLFCTEYTPLSQTIRSKAKTSHSMIGSFVFFVEVCCEEFTVFLS